MATRRRMTAVEHARRLRYWREYYRKNKSKLFHRPGKTVVTGIISRAFREATPAYRRAIQGHHRSPRTSKSTITRLRLSIAGKRRQPLVKPRSQILLGTRRSAQKRRGSRLNKGR